MATGSETTSPDETHQNNKVIDVARKQVLSLHFTSFSGVVQLGFLSQE